VMLHFTTAYVSGDPPLIYGITLTSKTSFIPIVSGGSVVNLSKTGFVSIPIKFVSAA